MDGYFLLNASAEYSVPIRDPNGNGFSTTFFFEGRNLLDTNFETGGILAENEVDGTGGSGTWGCRAGRRPSALPPRRNRS